jgi:site-specific DNA recombinase
MRCALYARYSTDKQSENSIDDQLRAAQERATREGWVITATYTDQGISGSTPVHLRSGGSTLLIDAQASSFDILIMEGLDRLSREIAEAERIVKHLEFWGVRIIGTSDGYDSTTKGRKVMRIARGLVNELYLDDLREKTHRGLCGNHARGAHIGGRAFGYRSTLTDAGPILRIDEKEAEIVREIFRRYADGDGLRTIVFDLNERNITTARSGSWAISALVGVESKGTGMLRNRTYIGEVIWNKTAWSKDPETGKRIKSYRPTSEWVTRTDESLRIIDDETWAKMRRRISTSRRPVGKPARTMFGGLLRCPRCAGPMVAINSERYGCSRHNNSGPAVCSYTPTFLRSRLDARLLTEVRNELLSPGVITSVETEAQIAIDAMAREWPGGVHALTTKLKQTEAALARVMDAILAVGINSTLGAKMKALEADKSRIQGELVAMQESTLPDLSVANVVARAKRSLMDLNRVLRSNDSDKVRTALTDIFGEIPLEEEATGDTYALIAEPTERLLIASAGGSVMMVAGAGFEPTTFGL